MMSTYALIKDGKVINTIEWEGPEVSPMEFGAGITYEEIPDSAGHCPAIGWLFKNGLYIEPELTAEEIDEIRKFKISQNISLKASFMDEATQIISVLQDAVDLEIANDEESTKLPLLKKYRVLLSRVNANTDQDVAWPAKP